jgi:hypothetical protein
MKTQKILTTATLLTVVILIIGSTVSGAAQSFSERNARAGITIGPGFSAGASMVTDSPEGFKVKPIFAWRVEANTTLPLTEAMNALMTLGVDSRGTKFHLENNSDIYTDWRVTYFSLYPQFSFSGFSLGINLGIPVSASGTSGSRDTEVDLKDVPVMIEPRIGGVIPLMDEEVGWLSLILGGGYCINDFLDVGAGPDASGVSAHLGLRFEFLLPGTERHDAGEE